MPNILNPTWYAYKTTSDYVACSLATKTEINENLQPDCVMTLNKDCALYGPLPQTSAYTWRHCWAHKVLSKTKDIFLTVNTGQPTNAYAKKKKPTLQLTRFLILNQQQGFFFTQYLYKQKFKTWKKTDQEESMAVILRPPLGKYLKHF